MSKISLMTTKVPNLLIPKTPEKVARGEGAVPPSLFRITTREGRDAINSDHAPKASSRSKETPRSKEWAGHRANGAASTMQSDGHVSSAEVIYLALSPGWRYPNNLSALGTVEVFPGGDGAEGNAAMQQGLSASEPKMINGHIKPNATVQLAVQEIVESSTTSNLLAEQEETETPVVAQATDPSPLAPRNCTACLVPPCLTPHSLLLKLASPAAFVCRSVPLQALAVQPFYISTAVPHGRMVC